MTDTELDRLLRSADPAAHRPAPAPGPLPHRPVVVPMPRRSGWLPIGSAAAVVAVVGVAVALLPSWNRGGIQAGAPGSPVPSTAASPSGPSESSVGTKPQRPHTASAGAEFERARRLLGTLQDAVPDRYTLPTGPAGNAATPPVATAGPGSTMPAANFQAVRDEGPYTGYTGYVYDADTIVRDGPRTGTVRARVYENIPDVSPCAVAEIAAWNEGTCSVVTTAAGPVAVVQGTGGDGSDPRETQWAVHRHADGTTVLVSQGGSGLDAADPPLTGPVWTQDRLVALATAPAFAAD